MRGSISKYARAGFLALATAALALAWLPMVRGLLDGASYEWGLSLYGHQFEGAGTGGDYAFLVVHTLIGLALLFLGWRSPGRFFKLVAMVWSAVLFGDQVWSVLTSPESMTFEGATLGMSLSVAMIFPLAYGLLFALALAWALTGEARPAPLWGRLNTVLLGVAVLLFPLQLLLLSTGRGQEVSDQIGVLMTIGQWLLVSLSFAPWKGSRPASTAVHARARGAG